MLVSFVGRPRLCGGRPWLSSARSRGSVARHEVRPLPARESARREVLRRVCGAAGGGGRLRALRDAPAAGSEILPGVRAAAGAAAPAVETRFASPAEYTPTHIAEKILDSRGALEGER